MSPGQAGARKDHRAHRRPLITEDRAPTRTRVDLEGDAGDTARPREFHGNLGDKAVARVRVAANDKKGRERLVRYMTRPALSEERLAREAIEPYRLNSRLATA